MAKPVYIAELEKRMDKAELKQIEFGKTIDLVLTNQAEQKRASNSQGETLLQIHTLLAGSNYEKKDNGGMCGDFQRLKKRVQQNTNWRIKITAAGTAVATLVTFVLVKFFAIINNLKELFNKQ